MRRTSYEAEYRKAILAMNEAAIEKEEQKEKEVEEKKKDFEERREAALEAGRLKHKTGNHYRNVALTEMLSTALKAIYIGAINEIDLLDANGLKFCESRVDQFIEEQGGATAVLSNMAGKTYLLSRLATIVEDAAEKAEEETDEEEKAAGTVPDKAKEDMFDELEKENEVDSAVTIIADRITSAEEEFIKKNAEDKKKIEDIVHDINDRIESVKNNDDMSEESQETAEEQLKQESTRRINVVYHGRDQKPLFEFMVRQNTDMIIKDPELKKTFMQESGKLDMDRIIDTTSYMYGFLEFVNTLGLAKIDEQYISEMVSM